MDLASRYQKMNLHDCLSWKSKNELQTDDVFTDSNFAVPPGLDVSSCKGLDININSCTCDLLIAKLYNRLFCSLWNSYHKFHQIRVMLG